MLVCFIGIISTLSPTHCSTMSSPQHVLLPSFSTSSTSSSSVLVLPTCSNCLKSLTKTPVKQCSRCKTAKYCGAICQRHHWKQGHHSKVCTSSLAVIAAPRGGVQLPASSAVTTYDAAVLDHQRASSSLLSLRSFQRWVEQNLHRDERNLRTLASTLCTRGWFSLESFPHGIMDQAGLSRCKKLLLSKVKDIDGLTERGHVVVWGQRGQGLEEHDATSPSPTDSTTVVVQQNVVATTTTITTAASLESLHRETCFQLLHSRMTLLTSSLRRLHSLLFDNFAVSSGLVGVVMDLRSLRHQSSTSAPSRCVAIKKPKHACAGAFLLLSNGNGKKLQGTT